MNIIHRSNGQIIHEPTFRNLSVIKVHINSYCQSIVLMNSPYIFCSDFQAVPEGLSEPMFYVLVMKDPPVRYFSWNSALLLYMSFIFPSH